MSKTQWLTARELLEIPESAMPLMVLSDSAWSLVAWGIRAHTSGLWNHAMVLYAPGRLASQEFRGLKRRLLAEYASGRRGVRLKFWRYAGPAGLSAAELATRRAMALARVCEDLRDPWWRHRYDFLGVFGQLLRRVGIQIPGLEYCSEQAGRIAAIMDPDGGVPARESPSGLDAWFKRQEGRWEVYGRFDPDAAS